MPVDIASGESAASESRQTGPGELLRKIRNDRGLSVEQVADDLHLGQHVVEALEAEQFAEIGAPVFVRGHLKAYARALRIDEAEVLDAYRAVQPDEPPEPVLARRAPQRRAAINPGPWAMAAVVVVLAGGLAVYVLRDKPAESVSAEPSPVVKPLPATELLPPPEPPEPVVAPVQSTPIAVTEAEPMQEAAPIPEAPAEEPAPAAPVAEVAQPLPEPEPVTEAPAVAPGLELELYFREESWVEISNTERRILFGLQREGMRRQLTGEPPIQFLLGNAPGVDIYLNGQPYVVPARNVNGKVARFTIDPSAEGGE